MTPPFRLLLIALAGLIICSSTLPSVSAATRASAQDGGRTSSSAYLATAPSIDSRLGRHTAARSARVIGRPSPRAARLARGVLVRVNRLRRSGMRCGGTWQRPVPTVRNSRKLAAAARVYARRMAVYRFFGHTDVVTGHRPGWRASSVGYRWATVGENIAAGYATPRAVIRAWRESPSHCRNMMDPRWRHLGVGWYHGSKSRWGHYWGQLFGRPA